MSVAISLTTSETASGISVVSATRSDNGESVSGVSFPFALTNSTGNVWVGSFTPTDATAPGSYLVGFIVTWPDGSTTGTEYATISAGSDYTGQITDTIKLRRYLGSINTQVYSDANATGVEDLASLAEGIDVAEAEIFNFFNGSPYTIPFVMTTGAMNPEIVHWANVGAAIWIYGKRGIFDEAKSVGGKFQALADAAWKRMEMYRSGYPFQLRNVQLRSDGGLGLAVVSPRENTISNDVGLIPTNQSRYGGLRLIRGYGFVTSG